MKQIEGKNKSTSGFIQNMNNSAITGRMLRVTINLRDNTTKEISEDVGNGSGDNINLKSLSQNLVSLQTKVNTFLSQQVDQERVTSEASSVSNDKQELEDGEFCLLWWLIYAMSFFLLALFSGSVLSFCLCLAGRKCKNTTEVDFGVLLSF